jgi:tetratricopeptide (TPR) repeat protein
MGEQSGSRLEKLKGMLDIKPGDPFLLYAIGLEYKKLKDTKSAIEFLDRTIQHDWGYCYAYYQKGMILQESGDVDAAKRALTEGLDAARRKGDQHAASEISAALKMLG